ncbi:MAG: endonuclease V [Candidatus Bathyarchaeia archaeon]|nr:endonuclease V [Candidatus Bathyarchaeota archaeon]
MFSIEKALKIQENLAKFISKKSEFKKLDVVAGVDAAYINDLGVGAAVLMDYLTLKPIEKAFSIFKVKVPYIPGFLSFRELPVIFKALKSLSLNPDIIIVNGHGLAHPRKFGLACHLGFILNKPTIGVAKNRLYGIEKENFLVNKEELIGYILKFKGRKKIYVSVGNKISLEDAIEIIKHCSPEGFPEPLKLAHKEALRKKQELILNKC